MKNYIKKNRVIFIIMVMIAMICGFFAYDQFNTAGGTKASKYVVNQIKNNTVYKWWK